MLWSVNPPLTVPILRDLMRHYQAWHSMYEASEAPDVLVHKDFSISLWDLEYLVECTKKILPPRQSEAIHWCLIVGLKESDAAERMGVSRTNPVSMYANAGLSKILAKIEAGDLPRFRYETERESA